MNGVPQTTFIPRKPVSDSVQIQSKGGKMFLAFGSILLVIAMLVSIALFSYKNFYVQKTLAADQTSLHSYAQQFDPGLISQMTTLNSQLSTAQAVLSQHVTFIPFFNFLAANTLVSVRFTGFSYAIINGTPTVTLKGEAAGFAALDAQESQLSQSGSLLNNPTVSDIALTKTGNVTFTIFGTLAAGALSYENEVAGSTSTPAAPLIP